MSHQVLRSGLSSNFLPRRAHQWYFELCKLAKRVANDATGFISIAVTSLNSIAQLAVVFKCKPAKRTFVLSYFWLPQYFGPMSISGCSGSPCCWLHFLDLMRFLSSCAAQLAGTLFRTKRCNQQLTQPQLVYSALGGRKCGRIPRTQPGLLIDVRSSLYRAIPFQV